MKKTVKYIQSIIVICISCICLLEIHKARNFIKETIFWVCYMLYFKDIRDEISLLNRHIAEWVFVIVIILCLIAIIIIQIFMRRKSSITKKTLGETGFERNLLLYLNTNVYNKCFLLKGSWGTGKTHLVNTFLDKYYRNTNRDVYKISCVGLTTRSDVIEELSRSIRQADTSLSLLISEFLKKIPGVGEALSKIFEKTYSYNSAKKNSIFVFDDFERVAIPLGDKNREITSVTNNNYTYKQNPEELKNILKEGNLELRQIKRLVADYSDKEDIYKYIPLLSVINDLVERCGYKVIIICNVDKISPLYFNEIILSKLNSIQYIQNISNKELNGVADSILNNYIFEDDFKKKYLSDYIHSVIDFSYLNVLNTRNLRILGNIIEAFIITVDKNFDVSELSEDYLTSIYASIVIYYYSMKTGLLGELKAYDVGANMGFIRVKCRINDNNLRWVGYDIAGYWFNSMPQINNIEEHFKTWRDYRFIFLERLILDQKYVEAFEKYPFELKHLCYLLNILNYSTEENGINWKKYFEILLKKKRFDNNKELSSFVETFEKTIDYYDCDIQNYVYKKIADKCNYKLLDQQNYLHSNYNHFVENYLNAAR